MPETKMVRTTHWSADKPEGRYFIAVCAPANTLVPYFYAFESQGDDVTIAKRTGKNPDVSLRSLGDDEAQALFLHFFNQQPLEYATTAPAGMIPSGRVILPAKATPRAGGTGAGQGKTNVETVLEKLGVADPLAQIIALAVSLRDKRFSQWGSVPVETAAAMCAMARVAIDVINKQNVIPTGKLASELVELRNAVCTRISDEDKGVHWWLTDTDPRRRIKALDTSAPAVIPNAA